jgi:hypothetical protein
MPESFATSSTYVSKSCATLRFDDVGGSCGLLVGPSVAKNFFSNLLSSFTLLSSLPVPVVVLSSLLPDVSLMLDVVRDIEVPLPETLVPVTLDPEMLVPEMLVPEMLEPETFVPEMLEPETLVPEMLEREMLLRPVALLVSLSLDPETLRLLEEVVTLEALVVLAPDDVTLEMLDFPALALGDTRGLAELCSCR